MLWKKWCLIFLLCVSIYPYGAFSGPTPCVARGNVQVCFAVDPPDEYIRSFVRAGWADIQEREWNGKGVSFPDVRCFLEEVVKNFGGVFLARCFRTDSWRNFDEGVLFVESSISQGNVQSPFVFLEIIEELLREYRRREEELDRGR